MYMYMYVHTYNVHTYKKHVHVHDIVYMYMYIYIYIYIILYIHVYIYACSVFTCIVCNIHVWQEFRQKLPSWSRQGEILQLVHDNQVVVLSGETGCGKTTQVRGLPLQSSIAQWFSLQTRTVFLLLMC